MNYKYKWVEELGRGGYGSIVRAVHTRTGKEVAIKREPMGEYSLLQRETKIYNHLRGIVGFPEVFWFGVQDQYYCMAMTLLGSSLRYPLSLDALRETGKQMIQRIESLHSAGFIHRDIKPDHFMYGKENPSLLYLIDVGFCKRYTDDFGNHIAERRGLSPTGTLAFVSLNVEKGIEPSRRDDLESMVYVLHSLWKRPLRENKIERMNEEGVPEWLKHIYKEIRGYGYEEKPDYESLQERIKGG